MKAKRIFSLIIVFCLMLAAALVLGTSIVTTIDYDMHYDVDWPQYRRENIPLLLILLAAVFLVFYILKKKNAFADSKRLIKYALIFCAGYCLMLILIIRPVPANDSMTLDNIINQFMEGDYSSLTDAGGYLFIWPFQLGYVAFGQIAAAVFGTANYVAWDLMQLASIVITVKLLYDITWEFFESREICGIMAVMSAGMLFFYNYVTYVYGDILSMAPQTFALYMMVLYIKRDRIRYAIFSALGIGFAVMLKTNCEIAVIALIMTLLLGTIKKDGFSIKLFLKNAALILVMLAVVFGIKNGVNAYYCHVTGLEEIPAGNPAAAHIAMGLQESELEDGWYNGYNYKVFEENSYDTEKTEAAAIDNIRQSLLGFVQRPLHGGRFFLRKFLTQWADQVCISTHNLDLVSRHVEGQSQVCDFLVFGKGSEVLKWIMNVYMTFCYFGVVVYLFNALRVKRLSDAELMLLILIFGGMLFHEFWEGSSRYAMRYYVYWIPFAACGIDMLLKKEFRNASKSK